MARAQTIPQFTVLDEVEKCEKELIEELMRLPDGSHARLIINSCGGSVYAGLGISTLIKYKRLKCEGVVLADCSSSALMIFAACETRIVAPHTSVLFHPMKWSSEDSARLSGAEAWAKEFKRVSRTMEDWLAEYLPLKKSTLRRWIKDEKYVTADELVKYGIARKMILGSESIVDISGHYERPSKKLSVAANGKKMGIRRAG